jgi:hypothetical protein
MMVRMVTIVVVLVTAASTKLAITFHILTHISILETTAYHWMSKYTAAQSMNTSEISTSQELSFSQQCLCIFKSYGVLCCIDK